MNPSVSIVIPAYNQATFLPCALKSILAQTYDDWEAIIIDDGSTDNTAAVATGFADPRIRYIYQKNQGLAAARNTGIRAARGIYLAFLDADDEWEQPFLQRCTSVLDDDKNLGGVYTLCYFIDQQSNILPRPGGCIVPPSEFRARNLEGGFFPMHAALIRASVCQKVGLFDTELTSEEDWDLWLRISAHYQLQGVSQPLARYRVYPGSMSTNAARMHANRIAVLTKYFGPPLDDPWTWHEEKRFAYAFAYRASWRAYTLQGQPDEAWQFLEQGVAMWPALLRRLDTMYELVCGDKPNGYRGQVDLTEIQNNASVAIDQLNQILNNTNLHSMRNVAVGNAYYAIAMLSEQAGEWYAARSYLWKAVQSNPRLVGDSSVLRRWFKLAMGPGLVGKLRRLRT